MSNAYRRKTLGILALVNPHEADEPPPVGFDAADWFRYPTLVRAVPGAWASDVVAGRNTAALAAAYAHEAQELEKAGVSAITADCGYTIAFQEAVRNAVSVPVACSSLMQIPLIQKMLPDNGRIGLLCFDAETLAQQPEFLQWAGLLDRERVTLQGIEGTPSWHNWVIENTCTNWAALEHDVMAAARHLQARDTRITHWLLECTGFPRFRPLIKALTGKPVFDWVSLCNHLMESSTAKLTQA